MEKTIFKKIQTILFLIIGVWIVILLVYLWMTPNIDFRQSRVQQGYKIVEDVFYQELKSLDTPIGIDREFRFILSDEIAHDTTLIFNFSHQNVNVYIGEEHVYALQSAEELRIIRTPGTNWAMIPLYREDIGKEVRVVLTPVYENYKTQEIQFLVGSKYAVYKDEMVKALPEMILSGINILVGSVLFGAAVYFSVKKIKGAEFYALAMLAVSLGLWNFTQSDFASFILQEKTVFMYYISLTMLMLCIIPLIKSISIPEKKLSRKVLELWCMLCSIVCIIQLFLQILGIFDLREMLKTTHTMIAVSSLLLLFAGLVSWFSNTKSEETDIKHSAVYLLGIGALIDMTLYYIKGNSSNLLFVLLAILCYVLIEGIQICFAYIRQQQILEEKEIQLTLSRITTMMSQIRSHFVFNILNAISGMCKYDPEKADETVVRFARYLRNNIDIMEDDKPVLFRTELAHLEDYVVLEQIRFGDKIEFYSDIRTEQFMIPPLILQPIVENAIKHGLTKKQNGGTVILRTWEEDGCIKISIEDDGVGFAPSELEKKQSVGLKNIRYRLHHLMHASLDIESKLGKGTTVTITIPKKEALVCE